MELVLYRYGRDGVIKQQSFDLGHSTKHHKLKLLMDKMLGSQDLTAAKLLNVQSPDKGIVKRLNCRPTRKVNSKSINIMDKRSKAHKELKQDQQKRLKEWEKAINNINTEPSPILVENTVDLEGPPSDFIYINDYKAMAGINIPEDPVVGCQCTSCFETKRQCCGPIAGAEFAYFKNKRVNVTFICRYLL